MKKQLLFFLFFGCTQVFWGQIKVERVNDIGLLQNQLIGKGLEITNFQVKGGSNQIGLFNDPLQILGIQNGLALATGDIETTLGPNNNSGTSTSASTRITDDLLNTLSSEIGVTYNDAIIIEFDFIPKGNIFSINYVFASEEYPEDDEDFPDFFGIWLTGPGFPTATNLALLPNTSIPVSTLSINDITNNQYYNSNGDGSTPLFNQFLGFDGYTDLMTAKVDVIPCQKYHIKIGIADANDHRKDSGVFIETKSLKTDFKPVINLEYDADDQTMIEVCADAKVTVNINNTTGSPLTFGLRYSGKADSSDFEFLPDNITIPAGNQNSSINLKAILDGLEGEEKILMKLISTCDTTFTVDSVEIRINDEFGDKLPDIIFCNQDTMQLDVFDETKDIVVFQQSDYISCSNCNNPHIYLLTNEELKYKLTDVKTGCEFSDTFKIKRFEQYLKYSLDTSVYYTVLDLLAKIDTSNFDRFDWTINQENYAGERIIHPSNSLIDNRACFDVHLIAYQDSLKCQVEIDTSICWDAQMLVPNIITPNNDGKNDFFVPLGISLGYWDFTVYNRYGKKVYDSPSYNFDFNGLGLSDGTYFYYLENKFKDRHYKGWLQIVR